MKKVHVIVWEQYTADLKIEVYTDVEKARARHRELLPKAQAGDFNIFDYQEDLEPTE